jgi:hypothetical protein
MNGIETETVTIEYDAIVFEVTNEIRVHQF